ncbi:class F sortase [Candidatus Kaiserbacteria bacterium]|nr:class F sortase [Candidatus Kaiserbacteria bacterium]
MKGYSLTFFVAIGMVLGIVVFVSTMTGALWYTPDSEVPAPALEGLAEQTASAEDYPVRLKIPAIAVDATVQYVGVNAKGNMAAPSNFTDVGWYKYGTVPGFVGSAVVTGHVDNALALPGVFKNLHALKVGDEIYMESKDGSELRFRVAEIQTYPYTHVPLKTLFSRRDLPRLNLITCKGAWLQSERSYDERLVVYAELVS